jgi:hypothetical protein
MMRFAGRRGGKKFHSQNFATIHNNTGGARSELSPATEKADKAEGEESRETKKKNEKSAVEFSSNDRSYRTGHAAESRAARHLASTST